jgi:hypothetical protein
MAVAACVPVRPLPAATIQTAPTSTEVKLARTGAGLEVMIQSPQGIGRATIVAAEALSDSPVWFRLELQGLEQFELGYDDTVIGLSVLTTDGNVLQTVQHAGHDPKAIDASSPYWIEVDIRRLDGQPVEFVLTAPSDFLQARPTTVDLAWVDFYR